MLVEDERGVAMRCAYFLREFAEVKVVHSGERAIELLRQSSAERTQYELLWVDLVLRGKISGHDVLAFARRASYAAVIFVVSGHETADNAFDAFQHNAAFLPKSCFLEKPFCAQTIRLAVLDRVWFELDLNHPHVLAECREMNLTPDQTCTLLGAANRRTVAQLREALGLGESAWKAQIRRLLCKLGLSGRSLHDAAVLFRARVLERMRVGRLPWCCT